jgi:DNA polymerase-1
MIIKTGLNEVVINYAANDVVYLEGIMNKQLAKAKEFDLENCIQLDNLFVRVLAYVEFCGIGFDWIKWQTKAECNVTDAQERKKILDEYVIDKYPEYSSGMFDLFSSTQECTINWDSSKQVIPFFEKLGIKCTVRDKGVEKKSIDAKKVLALQRSQFEILPLYLDYKESITLVNTFGLGWKKFINPVTKRIHSSFRQIQDTGRMACGEKGLNGDPGSPNLQNIPADQLTRSCFTAEKGNKVAFADYSSQEQRILANFSLVDTLLMFYKKGLQDMHGYVAFLMYPDIRPCEIDDITNDTLKYIKENFKDQRKLAKNAGFAINYGGNGSTISKNCGIPKKQGEFVYDSYFKSFPGLKEYFAWCLQEVKEKGYIQFNEVSKRKYFIRADNPFMIYKDYIGTHYMEQFPNPYIVVSEYKKAEAEIARLSQNYPIQGSAADMTKLACIAFFNQLIKRDWIFKVKMINIIHDEIGIEAPEELIEEATDVLTRCMVKAGDFFKTEIPYFAEAEIGDYWIH